jgi:hypothetical protein
MNNPATLLLSVALATIYGAGFHWWQGGGARRLALYLLAGWLGFALGQVVGNALGLTILMIGPLNFLTATLGSALALGLAHFLAISDVVPTGRDK